ncbi:MAG TPA: ribosome silencing factor [Steroidobacter sp.]|jgi:ribosome-associated protein|nr:ribosome silencing factor [Steroidobacter sp.]
MVGKAKTSRRSNSSAAKTRAAKRPTAKAAAKKAGVKKPAAKKPAAKTRSNSAPLRARPKAARGGVVKVVEGALDEMKAVDVKVLDVEKLTDITDTMIIASGNSDRHVRSIADRVIERAKNAGFRPMGVEGERDGEWVLVDLQDVIVHVMLARVREFYRLESLWDVSAARREAAAGAA